MCLFFIADAVDTGLVKLDTFEGLTLKLPTVNRYGKASAGGWCFSPKIQRVIISGDHDLSIQEFDVFELIAKSTFAREQLCIVSASLHIVRCKVV